MRDAAWLALAVHNHDTALSSWTTTKEKCDAAYKMIRPATAYMRLSVDANGQCKDVAKIAGGEA
eukprot:COSAG06_NODE_427_length_15900_cov_371.736519_5_plen_64_part_00